ncbi:MAG: type II secretion system F family protein [Pseudomonadota bacterium]
MNAPQIAFLGLVFVAVSWLTYLVVHHLSAPQAGQRLRQLEEGAASVLTPWHAATASLRRWLEPLARLTVPSGNWENSPLRSRFWNAGLRGIAAPLVYFASKTALTFLLPALFATHLALSDQTYGINAWSMTLLVLAAIGYYFPNAVLARLIARRQRELFAAFPDALDLMRICVEAGLGLDAAINRVGDEMRRQSEALYEELHLVSLELRAGAARDQALRNLALRMGLEDVDALVAMLVQAERFGTSVADSLRVHAESLRVKRRLRAEEAAATVPVKLLFPLIFCIFPALLVVLLGPAILSIVRVLLPTLTGH